MAVARNSLIAFIFILTLGVLSPAHAQTIQISAIGDSNIAGRGVSPWEAYPAKLETALRAKGLDVHMVNHGINGDTTEGVLARLDAAAPAGTQVAIVWIGVNDRKAGVPQPTIRANRQAIVGRLRARGIEVLSFDNDPAADLRGNPQYTVPNDPQHHLNAAGYDVLVGRTLGQVAALVQRAQQKGH
ncbi:MAG TPA: GDSL-type esterase/lipase family protein [Xanthobacteraceae bacterium]|nr:GDSL-type esterase/lipase family protein [Xanthobacteraceae bacterium]